MTPYNHKKGQTIQTDAAGVSVDRAFLAHLKLTAAQAAAASATGVHAAIALGAAAADVTTAITNPTYPRNITIQGNAAGITGNVVITGTRAGSAITETIALNGSTLVEGVRAFDTVTKINVPIQTHAGTDTVVIGWGDKLGIPYLLAHNTLLYKHTYLANVVEATEPTVTVSATALESNTIDLNSALNGSAVDAYFVV